MKNVECRMKNNAIRMEVKFFILHSTPLSLWRGVGGEASILYLFGKFCFHRVVSRITDKFILYISFLIYNHISRNTLRFKLVQK